MVKRPPISFISEASHLDKDNMVEFLVKVNPKSKDEKEKTCKKPVWIFKSGTADNVLHWWGQVQHVIRNKLAKYAQAKFNLVDMVIDNDVCDNWETK